MNFHCKDCKVRCNAMFFLVRRHHHVFSFSDSKHWIHFQCIPSPGHRSLCIPHCFNFPSIRPSKFCHPSSASHHEHFLGSDSTLGFHRKTAVALLVWPRLCTMAVLSTSAHSAPPPNANEDQRKAQNNSARRYNYQDAADSDHASSGTSTLSDERFNPQKNEC